MEHLLSPEDVCDLIPGMTTTGLAQLRYSGGGPVFHKPSPKKVAYAVADVEAWLRTRRFDRTDRPAAS